MSFFLVSLVLIFTNSLWAQGRPPVVKARVVTEGAMVYEAPSFDSEPLARLARDTQVLLINRREGLAFFRIRLADRRVGYITDLDVEFEGKRPPEGAPSQQSVSPPPSDPFLDAAEYESGASELDSHNQSFEWERLVGIRSSWIAFKERTMGSEPRSDLQTLGVVWRGPGWIDFAAYADLGFLLTTQAPSYYGKTLGEDPRGWSGWTYLLFSTSSQLSSRAQMVYGFGPFLRTSQWRITAQSGSGPRSYDALDVKIGGMGSWGVAYRFKPFALRGDFQYWWEATQYSSLSLALEIPF